MAYNKNEKKSERVSEKDYVYQYKKDYESDWTLHRDYIQNFDAWEAMLLGQVYDSVSKSIKGSSITDSYTTTLAKERADRVVAKLPEGYTRPIGQADVGKAALVDILRQKWVYPNANSQHPFLEKLNMWQFYSSVYGYMPMFYDWNVNRNGYVGPDCWLWNPRNLIPQQGRASISDMDYVTALTWVSKRYLENIMNTASKDKDNEDGWNRDAVRILLEKVDHETSDIDQDQDTKVQRDRTPQSVKRGILLATRYEAGADGNWCTFAPDHSYLEVRKVKNPHKNGRIPFVIKYSQPLFDSFYGLGDFQRAKSLQFARDGLTNFYFKGIKMNLIPPIVANANGVLKHTLDYREGSVMLETMPNSIRRLETSNAGLATYQAAQSNLTGSLLSLFGTQNASLPGAETLNPEQGKTPAAIKRFSGVEANRDGAELRHLESAIEELTDGFFSLLVNIGTENVPIELFSTDIEEIVKKGYKDVIDLFKSGSFQPDGSMAAGKLTINPDALKGVEYRFNIDANSTAKINKDEQMEGVERVLGAIGKFQNLFKDDPRVEIEWPKIMAAYESLSNVDGAKEFIKIKDGPSPQEKAVMDENQQLQQKLSEVGQELEMTKMKMAENQMQATAASASSQQQAAEADSPTVNSAGMFSDQDLAKVAEEVNKF